MEYDNNYRTTVCKTLKNEIMKINVIFKIVLTNCSIVVIRIFSRKTFRCIISGTLVNNEQIA